LAKEIFTLGAIPPHPLHIGSVKNHLIILFNTLFLAILGITLFRKQFFSNLEYRIVFAMLIVAFFIAFNFADRFNGVIYPNMTWQVPIVLNILYVLLLGIFAKPDAGIAAWRRWIFAGCFLLYFAYGLYYLYMVKVFHTFFI
jgi:Zn-dependent protease with chaperone function